MAYTWPNMESWCLLETSITQVSEYWPQLHGCTFQPDHLPVVQSVLMGWPDLHLVYFLIHEMCIIIGPTLCAGRRIKWRPHLDMVRIRSSENSSSLVPPAIILVGPTWCPHGVPLAPLCFPSWLFSIKMHKIYIPRNGSAAGSKARAAVNLIPDTALLSISEWWNVLLVECCCDCPLCGPGVQKKACLGIFSGMWLIQ